MVKIYIGSAYDPIKVIVDKTKTIKEVYLENRQNYHENMMVTINSRRLGDEELKKSLAELNVKDNDNIVVVEKFSSATLC